MKKMSKSMDKSKSKSMGKSKSKSSAGMAIRMKKYVIRHSAAEAGAGNVFDVDGKKTGRYFRGSNG